MVIILVYHLIMRSAPPTIFSPKKKEKKIMVSFYWL